MGDTVKPTVQRNFFLQNFFADNARLEKIQTIFPIVDKMYYEYAQENHFPGYAFGIMLDGQLIHSGSNGYSNINKKIPATCQSMFRIASITKSFTGMAIVKLRDEGKLKLDDDFHLYIPEINYKPLTLDAPTITIRDLLTHSAGLPQDDPWGDRNLDKTEEELINLLGNGIAFSNIPGITYEYSNLAYVLLGIIIKRISGVSYQEFIANNIWQPLGMKQATWEFTNIASDQLAHGYKLDNNHWQEEELLHDGSFGAMGGIITSIESFSRYVALHQYAWPARNDAEVGPLKRSSLREMHQPWRFHELNSQTTTVNAYGYGLRWSQDSEGKVYIGHSGGLPGFGSNWMIMPDYGIGVILFANITYAPASVINTQILETVVKEASLKPRQLPIPHFLKDRQNALLKLLPDWQDAENSGIFAENFFLDNPIDLLKKISRDLFAKASTIIQINDLIPENQLRGYFIVTGKKANIKISFTLTPQNPPLIQTCLIEQA